MSNRYPGQNELAPFAQTINAKGASQTNRRKRDQNRALRRFTIRVIQRSR